jgi:uncharacterized membrane protein
MADNKNDQVVIALFPSVQAAEQAVEALKNWDDANDDVKLGAIGTITKEGDKIKTHLGRKTGKGLAVGAVLGVVAAALGPVGWIGGAVAGGALGGVVGSFLKKSVDLDKEAIDKLGVELDRGLVAVVVACDDFEVGPTSDHLAMAGGTIYTYQVPAEAVEEASRVIESDELTAAATAAAVAATDEPAAGQGFAPAGAETER